MDRLTDEKLRLLENPMEEEHPPSMWWFRRYGSFREARREKRWVLFPLLVALVLLVNHNIWWTGALIGSPAGVLKDPWQEKARTIEAKKQKREAQIELLLKRQAKGERLTEREKASLELLYRRVKVEKTTQRIIWESLDLFNRILDFTHVLVFGAGGVAIIVLGGTAVKRGVENKELKNNVEALDKKHERFVAAVRYLDTPEYRNEIAYRRAHRYFKWFMRDYEPPLDLDALVIKSRLFRAFVREIRQVADDGTFSAEDLQVLKLVQYAVDWTDEARDLLVNATNQSEQYRFSTDPLVKIKAQRNYLRFVREARKRREMLEAEHIPLSREVAALFEYHEGGRYEQIEGDFIPLSWTNLLAEEEARELRMLSGVPARSLGPPQSVGQ